MFLEGRVQLSTSLGVAFLQNSAVPASCQEWFPLGEWSCGSAADSGSVLFIYSQEKERKEKRERD